MTEKQAFPSASYATRCYSLKTMGNTATARQQHDKEALMGHDTTINNSEV